MKTPVTDSNETPPVNRRKFLAGMGATAAGISALPISASANVAGSDRLKVGIVGTGGRGSGAVLQTLSANPGAQLVAAGDVFKSRLQGNGPRKAGGLNLIKGKIKQRGQESQIDLPKDCLLYTSDAADE